MTKAIDSTAALAVMQQRGLVLSDAAETQLAMAGFGAPIRRAEAIAVAILAGMDPTQLARPKNIIVLSQAWRSVQQYGAMPGIHFYLTPYEVKKEQGKSNWVVEGIDYAFVPSVNWLQSSVAAHGRSDNFSYQLDVKPILGADKRREYLENYAPEGWESSSADRVAIARFIPIHIRTGEKAFEPEYQVGYYLGVGFWVKKKNGDKYLAGSDAAMPSDRPNNTPQAKAQRRAIRAAARIVTRELIPVDANSTQERFRLLAQMAYEKAIDMGPNQLRQRLPDEANDIMAEDYIENEDDAINIHPDPAEVDREVEEETLHDSPPLEDDGLTWNDLSLLAQNSPGVGAEGLATIAQLSGLHEGKRALPTTMKTLRDWITLAAQGNEVLGQSDEGINVTLADFVFYCLFGVNFGDAIYAKQASVFFPLIAKENKNAAWSYVDDSEGARLIRAIRDALAKEKPGVVAETF